MSQTVNWAIARAFLHAKGKATVPATGTSKYNALLGIADSVQKMWASEPGTDWSSLYVMGTLSSVVSTTATYTLPTDINYVSEDDADPIRLISTSQTAEYELVKPNQLWTYRTRNVCAQEGDQLVFPSAFASDSSLIGATIKVPYIRDVEDITIGTQEIEVDDPMWMVYMMAAELDRNDLVKVGQYSNLISLASEHMQKMKESNQGQRNALVMDWSPEGMSWT